LSAAAVPATVECQGMSGMRHTWRFELKTRFNTPEMTLSKYSVKRLKWRFILKSAIKAPR
jgi:hypothetical protein